MTVALSEPTVRRTASARRIEAEWQTGPDTFFVLTAAHSTGSKAFVATVRRERAGAECGGWASRTYMPFGDVERVAVERVARYSPKALEAFFAAQLAAVTAALDDPSSVVGALVANPTTA